MATTAVAASRKHVELSLELKRKLIQEHEHGVPFTLLGKKYHIATSTAANIWRKKDFFLRSRMSGSRKRCNDRSKYKIVNQVTALFVKSMLERNHKIDGEVIKRFARTAAAQCNFKDFHGSNGWLDSFKKRENVCWVRRRAAGNGNVNGSIGNAPAIGPIPTTTVGASTPSSSPSSSSASTSAASSTASLTSSTSAGNLVLIDMASGGSGPSSLTTNHRCDSPNLSTAAAAAAVAATANAQHQHHHHHHQQPQQQPQHQHHQQDQLDLHNHNSHDCWDESESEHGTTCARCSVAAAAAAIAALNSNDSIHQRDHEIDDWFHGIPFLCQFFEEYQSMHQPQQSQMQHQRVDSHLAIAGTSNGSGGRNCRSKTSPARGETSTAMSRGSSSSVLGSATTSATGSSATNTNSNGIIRSLSDAHELINTSSFRASSSLADIQSLYSTSEGHQAQTDSTLAERQVSGSNNLPGQLQRTISTEMLATSPPSSSFNQQIKQEQQQQYEVKYETSGGANNFQVETNFPVDNKCHLSDSGDHLMEVNFSDEVNSSNQQQLLGQRDDRSTRMDCMLICSKREPHCCVQMSCSTRAPDGNGAASDQPGAGGGSGPCTIISSDYNSDDQDFYMQTTRYISHSDAQSDDLLYHDEVSDHNDCCSDHYERVGLGRQGSADQNGRGHVQDYQTDLGAGGGSGGSNGAAPGACYMDEYEYENISTIRHYPVPMPVAPSSSASAQRDSQSTFGSPQQQSSAGESNLAAIMSGGHLSLQQQHHHQQQQHQLSLNNQCQQQTTALDNQFMGGQSSLAAGNGTAGENQLASFQANHQSNGATEESRFSAMVANLHDHEQTIEHADHEEHNMLHNALMRSPEKLKLIDSIITLLNYASNYNQKMLSPLLEIKRCIERDLEVVLSDTAGSVGSSPNNQAAQSAAPASDRDNANHHAAGCSNPSPNNSNSTNSANSLSMSGRHNSQQQQTQSIGGAGEQQQSRDSLGVVNKLNVEH